MENKNRFRGKGNYYDGLAGIYFHRIQNKIIELGNLRNANKILDYGCYTGELKKKLGNKVINYDINPDLSEVDDWKSQDFDVVVSNQVFVYLLEEELTEFIFELKKKNKNVTLIVGLPRLNFMSNICKSLTGNSKAHEGISLDSNKVLEILTREMNIIKKLSVFAMCELYLMKFKTR